MQRKQAKPDNADVQRITELVSRLNHYRYEYYNLAKPSVSDAVYDRLFDELASLERKTGIVLSNSPTQTVGYAPVSALRKVRHTTPLLSLDKTKQVDDLVSMIAVAPALLMLKLDGLTVKLRYENGELVEASTRGDGEVGEDITHNIPAFCNVPSKIPHKGNLTITGEGLIHTDDFEHLFDPVEIDGCTVSRASLHNLSFIKDLELHPDCRILVSKRNMIIPHIEENLDRGCYAHSLIPKRCPCCGKPTRIYARSGGKGGQVATLHCDNPDCGNQTLRKFVHFVGKKAMDISGISEAILDKFISKGFLTTYQDLYHLDRYRDQIIRMEGFDVKSYEKLQKSINISRKTTFARCLVAMDIPVIGRTASRALDNYFGSNLDAFEKAATSGFDFTALPDFGATLSGNIHDWFQVPENLELWRILRGEFEFEDRKDVITMANKKNPFGGCTIVATGKLEHFTRDSINSKIASLGATAGSSVTRKTSYLICGEKPGSKLTKAQELGIPFRGLLWSAMKRAGCVAFPEIVACGTKTVRSAISFGEPSSCVALLWMVKTSLA